MPKTGSYRPLLPHLVIQGEAVDVRIWRGSWRGGWRESLGDGYDFGGGPD
jgi:hypothetical protein